MKIICMDCQTESHVDPEMVKGKKHIECGRCAADFRARSGSKIADSIGLTANEDAGLTSDSVPEQLPEGQIQWPADEDVLDISVVPFAPSYPEPMNVDDFISLAQDETKAIALVEETSAPHSEQALANHSPESIVQPLPESEPVCEPSTPGAFAETHLPEAEAVSFSGESNKVRLAAFSTPKLITLAATFILFISVAGMINSPVGKVNLKAQSPAPAAVNSTEKEVEQKTASATSVPVVETSKPTPSTSPVDSQENTGATTTPPANQPVVNEATVNQSAVNEPVATDDARLTVQVGSHNQMDLADVQAEKLRAAGYDPRVVSVEIPKRGRWHRVQVGKFSDRQEAQQFGAQLVSKGVVESFVIADK